jgi:L-lactate dehydrogenase (cytochrome)
MGKAFLYSLAAGGQAGVALGLEIIRRELSISMALSGATDIHKVDRSILWER